jgi:hypothetical protein
MLHTLLIVQNKKEQWWRNGECKGVVVFHLEIMDEKVGTYCISPLRKVNERSVAFVSLVTEEIWAHRIIPKCG